MESPVAGVGSSPGAVGQGYPRDPQKLQATAIILS